MIGMVGRRLKPCMTRSTLNLTRNLSRSANGSVGDQGESVLLEFDDQTGIATITMNRPSVHNALSAEMIATFSSKLDEVQRQSDENPELRGLFLRSNGRNFSAGADLEYMRELGTKSRHENVEDAMKLSGLFTKLATISVPTIALVQGRAFGGALGLISACDVAICERRSLFCFSEVKLGIIPATISPFVIEKIGASNARRLFITAETFDDTKALNIGLVHEIVEDSEGLEEARRNFKKMLLTNGPQAMRKAKKLVDDIVQERDMEMKRRISAEVLAEVRESAEAREGLTAFLEKRNADYNIL